MSALKNLIDQSSLSEEEKQDFYSKLEHLDDFASKMLIELFEEDISWVEKLYKNYQEKKALFESQGKEAVEEMLDQEIEAFEV